MYKENIKKKKQKVILKKKKISYYGKNLTR